MTTTHNKYDKKAGRNTLILSLILIIVGAIGSLEAKAETGGTGIVFANVGTDIVFSVVDSPNFAIATFDLYVQRWADLDNNGDLAGTGETTSVISQVGVTTCAAVSSHFTCTRNGAQSEAVFIWKNASSLQLPGTNYTVKIRTYSALGQVQGDYVFSVKFASSNAADIQTILTNIQRAINQLSGSTDSAGRNATNSLSASTDSAGQNVTNREVSNLQSTQNNLTNSINNGVNNVTNNLTASGIKCSANCGGDVSYMNQTIQSINLTGVPCTANCSGEGTGRHFGLNSIGSPCDTGTDYQGVTTQYCLFNHTNTPIYNEAILFILILGIIIVLAYLAIQDGYLLPLISSASAFGFFFLMLYWIMNNGTIFSQPLVTSFFFSCVLAVAGFGTFNFNTERKRRRNDTLN